MACLEPGCTLSTSHLHIPAPEAEKKHYTLPAHLVQSAIAFLKDHASKLESDHFPASAAVVEILVSKLQAEVDLQTPQTVAQQVAVLTAVMGCGPTDDFKGNRD